MMLVDDDAAVSMTVRIATMVDDGDGWWWL